MREGTRRYNDCLDESIDMSDPWLTQWEACRNQHGALGAADRDAIFGKVRGGTLGKFAVGGAPKGSTGIPFGIIAHAAPLLLGWKFSGRAWPHPFFDKATRSPRYPVTTITPEEREALRSKCGPSPTA